MTGKRGLVVDRGRMRWWRSRAKGTGAERARRERDNAHRRGRRWNEQRHVLTDLLSPAFCRQTAARMSQVERGRRDACMSDASTRSTRRSYTRRDGIHYTLATRLREQPANAAVARSRSPQCPFVRIQPNIFFNPYLALILRVPRLLNPAVSR